MRREQVRAEMFWETIKTDIYFLLDRHGYGGCAWNPCPWQTWFINDSLYVVSVAYNSYQTILVGDVYDDRRVFWFGNECQTTEIACLNTSRCKLNDTSKHYYVIKWKHFLRYWPFVREIHRSPVNSPHKGQWRDAFMFSLICAWINRWVNNREAGDLRRFRPHYDVIVMTNCWQMHV